MFSLRKKGAAHDAQEEGKRGRPEFVLKNKIKEKNRKQTEKQAASRFAAGRSSGRTKERKKGNPLLPRAGKNEVSHGGGDLEKKQRRGRERREEGTEYDARTAVEKNYHLRRQSRSITPTLKKA